MFGDSLFEFKHGDHICVFYSDIASLLDVLTPFIAEGLRNNERCFCAQPPEILRALSTDLRFLGIDTEREVKRGALELHTTNEVYFPNRQFEPLALMELLERSIADSVRQGFSGFRPAGDLSWAVDGRDECDRLLDYEKLVEASYPGKPVNGICQYPIKRFKPDVLKRVVDAHKKVLDNSAPESSNVSLCIRDSKCEAEIVVNKLTVCPSYHYVVGRDRGDVLGWGESANFDAALKGVQRLISEVKKQALHFARPRA
jgi:hypothetical protein